MKKQIFLYALLATIACTAFTSCIDHQYDMDNMDGMDVTVAVEESAEVESSQLLFGEETTVTSASDGVLYVEKFSDTVLEMKGAPKAGSPVRFTESISIPGEEIPENSNGCNPGALLRITNDGKPVLLRASITCGGVTEVLPEVVIDGGGEHTVFYGNGDDLPAPEWADVKALLPESLRYRLGEGFTIHDIEIGETGTKGTVSTADEEVYTYTVETAYCSPLVYTEGQTLYIERSFSDISMDIDKYIKELPGNRFSVKVSVTSTIPFDITGRIVSDEGVTGVLDNCIKAGTVENPVTTEAVFTVTVENRDVKCITNATVCAYLKAPADAVLKDSQTLQVDVKELTVNIK